jgi:DNA-binding CsgD family transcriptional regulator
MPSDALPSGLSIREEQVFRLVREGRLDAEIAVRLGVGADEVKLTVTVLMSKCGVSDRAGLLAWEPHEQPREHSPWVERLADRAGNNLGTLLITAIILGIGGIFLWRALTGDDEPADLSGLNRTPTVSATATPSPTPTGTTAILRDGVPYEPLTYLEPHDFPRDTVMYVTGGCELCAGREIPGEAVELIRIYRDRNGIVHEDILFGSHAGGPYVTSWAAIGGEFRATLCEAAQCSGGATHLYGSNDYGVTWTVLAELAGNARLAGAVTYEEFILAVDDKATGTARFSLYPSGVELMPPRFVEPLGFPVMSDSGPLWRDRDGRTLYRFDGVVFGVGARPRVHSVPSTAAGFPALISLETIGPDESRSWVTVLGPGEIHGWTGGAIFAGPFIRGQGIYATVQLPGASDVLPATFTPEDGVVIPIAAPFTSWEPARRDSSMRVLAVRQMERIARVTTGGECAPVLGSTGGGGTQLACYPDGFLVSVSEAPIASAGEIWWRIDDIVGGPGFISDAHLAR